MITFLLSIGTLWALFGLYLWITRDIFTAYHHIFCGWVLILLANILVWNQT